MIFEIILTAVVVGCVVYISKGIYDSFENYERPWITKGFNDDFEAICHIKEVVKAAIHRVEIFDDGDKVAGGKSVYDDQEFLDLVSQKVQQKVHFLCLFNSDNPDMAFRKKFDQDDHVEIRIRKRPVASSNVHYKNADKGRMAYLTIHQPHSAKRRFKMIDARHMSDEYRQSLDQILNEWRQSKSDFQKVNHTEGESRLGLLD